VQPHGQAASQLAQPLAGVDAGEPVEQRRHDVRLGLAEQRPQRAFGALQDVAPDRPVTWLCMLPSSVSSAMPSTSPPMKAQRPSTVLPSP
jgi:hypothetical protein